MRLRNPSPPPNSHSAVEAHFLGKSTLPFLSREEERIPVITVSDYVDLGRMTALRFLEWVAAHPEGVVALPTGRTPEYFIKWLRHFIVHWRRESREGILKRVGLMGKSPPSLKKLSFVQLDEFFPMDPANERSFHCYVRKQYLEGFGFDPSRALLIDAYHLDKEGARGLTLLKGHTDLSRIFPDGAIDLGLRERKPSSRMEALQMEALRYFDQFCEGYERRIRALGGIGFFLGGIGPDGHIAFNVRGSSHYSHTRLTKLNYETMATSASDLGGMEAARGKGAITIGLETIAYNPQAVAILFAAGEAKAEVIARAIENPPHVDMPASALQKMPSARFYLTQGAASKLKERRFALLERLAMRGPGTAKSEKRKDGSAMPAVASSATAAAVERLVLDAALRHGCSLIHAGAEASRDPNDEGARSLRMAAALTARTNPAGLGKEGQLALLDKIRRGIRNHEGARFLHTGPHHDDIELAYFPLIHHLVRSEKIENHFCYLTSGFTSVTNRYLLERLQSLQDALAEGALNGFLVGDSGQKGDRGYREIHGYLNAIAQRDDKSQALFTSARLYRFFRLRSRVKDSALPAFLQEQILRIRSLQSGKIDPPLVQELKGWLREWEAELVWAHFGLGPEHVTHLRLPFYGASLFPKDPDYQKDVLPLVELLERVRPTVVTLAMDPEGSGPDTHFKALLALRQALEIHAGKQGGKKLRVWGYRNVWSRFHLSEVNTVVPVSLNSLAVLQSMFMTCFASQSTASFPSYELDGTFSELAQKIWVEQFRDLAVLLGRSAFYKSGQPMLRRAFGAIYLKDMSYAEFVRETRPIQAMLDLKQNLS